MKRNELMTRDDIWNVVIDILSEADFPTENKVLNEIYMVFQYYSELESGGHESLLTWFTEYIEEVGISAYLKEIVESLEEIGAYDYAVIVNTYGKEMWKLFVALENSKIEEKQFYTVIEKADNAYNKLDGKLEELLVVYFVEIHKELIEG
ncbi:DMP19 family protein [Sporosarcina sp. G11-34]|uniref:DMP19 family protein n=1 Tax=Sporosarcina sp. G11-34 TaxID=2849605 RepID=UPI0022A97E90|nr:hypothetical protein [Sporosarcina sp. G11-34]MCZ2259517.1 hypothetical protein [Sporosarcina sp. G11-34]